MTCGDSILYNAEIEISGEADARPAGEKNVTRRIMMPRTRMMAKYGVDPRNRQGGGGSCSRAFPYQNSAPFAAASCLNSSTEILTEGMVAFAIRAACRTLCKEP